MTVKAGTARRWSEEDDARLRELVAAGHRLSEIAAQLGRSVDGIRSHAQKLRLTLRTTLRPWRALNRKPTNQR